MILLKLFFKILQIIANILLTPVVGLLSWIFNFNFGNIMNNVQIFVDNSFKYFSFFCKFIGLDSAILSLFLNFVLSIIIFNVGLQIFVFFRNLYVQFKP